MDVPTVVVWKPKVLLATVIGLEKSLSGLKTFFKAGFLRDFECKKQQYRNQIGYQLI